jgi:hypothetical protein
MGEGRRDYRLQNHNIPLQAPSPTQRLLRSRFHRFLPCKSKLNASSSHPPATADSNIRSNPPRQTPHPTPPAAPHLQHRHQQNVLQRHPKDIDRKGLPRCRALRAPPPLAPPTAADPTRSPKPSARAPTSSSAAKSPARPWATSSQATSRRARPPAATTSRPSSPRPAPRSTASSRRPSSCATWPSSRR